MAEFDNDRRSCRWVWGVRGTGAAPVVTEIILQARSALTYSVGYAALLTSSTRSLCGRRASLEGHRQRRQDKRRKSQPDGAAPAQPRAHQGAGSASDLAAADTAESAEQTGGEGTRQQRGKRQRQESRSVQEAEPAPAVAAAAVAPAQGSDAAAAEQQSMQQLAEHLPSVVQQLVQLVQQATEHQGALPPPKQQAPPPQQQPPIAPRLPFGGQQQAAVPQASTAAPAATAPPLQLAAQQTQLAPPPPLPPQLPHHQGAHRLAPPPSSLPESRLFGAFLGQQLAVQQGLQQGVNMLRAPQLPAALVKELTELRGGLTGGGRLPPRADLVSEALRLLRTEQVSGHAALRCAPPALPCAGRRPREVACRAVGAGRAGGGVRRSIDAAGAG